MRCPACHRHFSTYDNEPPDSCPYCLHEREDKANSDDFLFQHTLAALRDCYESEGLYDADVISDDERKARTRLIALSCDIAAEHRDEMRTPTAISGTWSDVERAALHIYIDPNTDKSSVLFDLAEAVLVLLVLLNERS